MKFVTNVDVMEVASSRDGSKLKLSAYEQSINSIQKYQQQ